MFVKYGFLYLMHLQVLRKCSFLVFNYTHAHLSVPVDGGRGEAGDVTPELEPVPLPDPHLPRAPRLYPRCGGH
jgi:hypothetical protein